MSCQEHEKNESLIWVRSFDEKAAQDFAEAVIRIASNDKLQPITIYIDSYGGEVYGLRTMLSVMDSVVNPLITVATGKAMSAAAVLLSHGDMRCVGKHASIMIHEVSGGAVGHIDDVNNNIIEMQMINKHMVELLAKNCKKTVPQLKKLWAKRRDIYMTAQQAVKFGIADHIGLPTIDQGTMYQVNFLEHPSK